MADIRSAAESPPKGRTPTAISYSITPREKMSARASTRSPRSCSGAMYGTVPTIAPSVDRVAVGSVLPAPAGGPTHFARPKSSTFTRPSSLSMTFAGLRSRWTTPRSCAAESAPATSAAISSTRERGRPPGSMATLSGRPVTRSIAITRWPSISSMAWRVTMFGWLRAATARASRSKRARRAGSCAVSAGRTFSATSRPSRVSRAR
jgi:hypothetical protein